MQKIRIRCQRDSSSREKKTFFINTVLKASNDTKTESGPWNGDLLKVGETCCDSGINSFSNSFTPLGLATDTDQDQPPPVTGRSRTAMARKICLRPDTKISVSENGQESWIVLPPAAPEHTHTHICWSLLHVRTSGTWIRFASICTRHSTERRMNYTQMSYILEHFPLCHLNK